MRTLRFVAIAAVLTTAIVFVVWRNPGKVKAQTASGCDATSLNTSFGYSQSGFFYDSNGLRTYAGSGRVVADGNGNLSGADTFNYDGVALYRRNFTGTYTVKSDCTGSIAVAFDDQTTGHADILVVNDGKEVVINGTDADFIYTGSWKRFNQAVTPPATTTGETSARRN